MERPPRATFLASFGYAAQGLAEVVRTQRNFRVHLLLAALAVGMAAWLRLSRQEWALLVLVIGFVLEAEIFNTAAEVLVDLASPRYHPLAKQVKDMAAGAVLLAALIALLIGLCLFGPSLWLRLMG